MCNLDIRKAAQEANVRLWQIAERFGLNDGNFSRKLRRELSANEKARIYKIIVELKDGQKNE